MKLMIMVSVFAMLFSVSPAFALKQVDMNNSKYCTYTCDNGNSGSQQLGEWANALNCRTTAINACGEKIAVKGGTTLTKPAITVLQNGASK